MRICGIGKAVICLTLGTLAAHPASANVTWYINNLVFTSRNVRVNDANYTIIPPYSITSSVTGHFTLSDSFQVLEYQIFDSVTLNTVYTDPRRTVPVTGTVNYNLDTNTEFFHVGAGLRPDNYTGLNFVTNVSPGQLPPQTYIGTTTPFVVSGAALTIDLLGNITSGATHYDISGASETASWNLPGLGIAGDYGQGTTYVPNQTYGSIDLFDAQVSVPEPSSLAILTALLGLAGIRTRMRQRP